jgi:hypothetical protein
VPSRTAVAAAAAATAHEITITSEDEASGDEAAGPALFGNDAKPGAAAADRDTAASAAADQEAAAAAKAATKGGDGDNFGSEFGDADDDDGGASGYDTPRSSASYTSAQSFRSFKSAGGALLCTWGADITVCLHFACIDLWRAAAASS